MGLFGSKKQVRKHAFNPVNFATGDGTETTLRFNVIGEASSHDRPIVIEVIHLFQEIAGAKISDYPSQAAALADASMKQMQYYNLLDSLEDKEIKEELDRIFSNWLNS